MIKREELSNPNSCINRAREDEMTFVLLGRDAAAPYAIRCWAEQRVALGKNKDDDPQITEARECATAMEETPRMRSARENGKKGGRPKKAK